MLNNFEEINSIYNDAEWVTVKNQSGVWLRITEVGGLSLIAKWIRNDLLDSGNLDILGDPIDTLGGLGRRTLNALRVGNINTIGDLCSLSLLDLRCMVGIGDLGRQQIVEALKKRNLQLRQLPPIKR